MATRMGSIQHTNINANTAGSNALVPAQAEMDVLIVNYLMLAAGAVVVTLEDSGTGTDRVGPLPFAANGGVSAPDSQVGWQRTAEGQGLNIRLDAAVRVGGSISWRYIPHHMRLG